MAAAEANNTTETANISFRITLLWSASRPAPRNQGNLLSDGGWKLKDSLSGVLILCVTSGDVCLLEADPQAKSHCPAAIDSFLRECRRCMPKPGDGIIVANDSGKHR